MSYSGFISVGLTILKILSFDLAGIQESKEMTPMKISQPHPKLKACEYFISPLCGTGLKVCRLLQGIVPMTHAEFHNIMLSRGLQPCSWGPGEWVPRSRVEDLCANAFIKYRILVQNSKWPTPKMANMGKLDSACSTESIREQFYDFWANHSEVINKNIFFSYLLTTRWRYV